MLPSARVLDLFAVPDTVRPLPGGQGLSVLAGDLVLSPRRDPDVQNWLSPVLARLALRLDQDPARRRQDLRVAMPVPARDGSWVVEGWAAARYEEGAVACRDVTLIRSAGHLLHARLAVDVPERPAELDTRTDRWAVAERVAFGERPVPPADATLTRLVTRAREAAEAAEDDDAEAAGRAQLVHADLAGNVLLDVDGAPVVIDLAPAWRPARWADAVCLLDAVMRGDAPRSALQAWAGGAHRSPMLRAVVFRALSDDPPDLDAYADALTGLGA